MVVFLTFLGRLVSVAAIVVSPILLAVALDTAYSKKGGEDKVDD